LHDTLDPEARDAVREMLVHASTVVDVGRAIDYYDRFEHAAMIVTSADLGGFTHETLGILSAILRQADDDIRLGPYRRLIDGGDRSAVLRAATVLALADELKRRIPHELPAVISCTWHPAAFVVEGPFRFVRHPAYSGDLALWLGSALATLDVLLLVLWPLYVLGAWAQSRVEDQLLESKFGSGYRRYAARVGAFLPRWRG